VLHLLLREPPVARVLERALKKALGKGKVLKKAPEKALGKPVARVLKKAPEKALGRVIEKAPEKALGKALGKPVARALKRAQKKAKVLASVVKALERAQKKAKVLARALKKAVVRARGITLGITTFQRHLIGLHTLRYFRVEQVDNYAQASGRIRFSDAMKRISRDLWRN
jgi:hypothetical protein